MRSGNKKKVTQPSNRLKKFKQYQLEGTPNL